VKGWDFGDHDNDVSSEPLIDPVSGIDVGYHGTFVAGLAAAATNNAKGIAGAGWNCRFMPLRVASADSGGITLEAVTEAFSYLTHKGAAVLNMSFGTRDAAGGPYFQALVDAANAVDILVVAAAGNNGSDTLAFPGACQGVLAVGATTESNTRASFSNWGPWVDIAAPGETIWSSIASNYTYDFLNQLYLILSGWDGESPYVYADGTSFASPLVAGICGLVRSKFPSLPAAAVLRHVVQTGDVVAYDHPIGPRVNAFRALNEPLVGVEPAAAPGATEMEMAYPNPFAAGTTIAFTLPASAPVRLRLYDAGGRMVRELVRANFPPGRHAILWDGIAADGRPAQSGIYFASLETPVGRSVRKLVLAR
jgi:thermitase